MREKPALTPHASTGRVGETGSASKGHTSVGTPVSYEGHFLDSVVDLDYLTRPLLDRLESTVLEDTDVIGEEGAHAGIQSLTRSCPTSGCPV